MFNATDARKLYDDNFKPLTENDMNDILENMGNAIKALCKKGYLETDFTFTDENKDNMHPFLFTKVYNLAEVVRYIMGKLVENGYRVNTILNECKDGDDVLINKIVLNVDW